MFKIHFLAIFTLLTLATVALGQDEVPADTSLTDSLNVPDTTKTADTLLFQGTDILNGTVPVTDTADLEKHLYQKPMIAMAKSLVVPGWGQYGNRRYVKAALFLGLDAWLLSNAIKYGNDAADYRDQWEQATDTTLKRDLYYLYKDKKTSRNKYTWFVVIVTFISMFDAYVDAHLSGYPQQMEEPAITLNLEPYGESGLSASVALSF